MDVKQLEKHAAMCKYSSKGVVIKLVESTYCMTKMLGSPPSFGSISTGRFLLHVSSLW
jgi:hypothetical protein